MNTTEYGVYHLADNPNLYQPVRTNNFRFLVTGLDKLLRAGGDANDKNDYIYNAQEVLDFSVVSFDPTHFSQDEVSVSRGNSTIYYAGKASFDTSKLEINDFVGADGKSVLEAWQALSYDVVNDVIPPSTQYKTNAMVLEYSSDNKLIRYWELIGCWVKSISETGYNAEQAGKKTVSATIRYDRAIPHSNSDLSL